MKKKLFTRILTICLATVLFLGDCGIANAAGAFDGSAVSVSETVEITDADVVAGSSDTTDTSAAAMGKYGAQYSNYYPGAGGYHHNMLRSKLIHYQGYTGMGVTVAVLGSGEELDCAVSLINEPGITGSGGAVYNNIGVAPDATVFTVLVEKEEGTLYADGDDIAAGIDEALAKNADIICLAVGSRYYSKNAELAVTRAYERGVPVFVLPVIREVILFYILDIPRGLHRLPCWTGSSIKLLFQDTEVKSDTVWFMSTIIRNLAQLPLRQPLWLEVQRFCGIR